MFVRIVRTLKNDQLGQKWTVLSSLDAAKVNDDEEVDADEISDLIVLQSPNGNRVQVSEGFVQD